MVENEPTTKSDDTGKKPDPIPEKDKPISLVDEARGLRDEIRKEKLELKEEREKLDKLKADQLLSGTGGGHIESKPAEETNHEYRMRVEKQMAEGKFDDRK